MTVCDQIARGTKSLHQILAHFSVLDTPYCLVKSFVFTRYTFDCKYKHDRQYRQCDCPKWVEARVNGKRIRKSVSTRIWDEAELLRQRLEDSVAEALPPIASRTAKIVSSTLASTSPEPVLATSGQVVLPRKHSAVGYDTSPVPAAPDFAVVTPFLHQRFPSPAGDQESP